MNRTLGILAALAVALPVFSLSLAPRDASAKKKPVAGGAMQRTSVEGCMNQYVFDGVWRVKVLDYEKGSYYGTAGYAVKIQVRNGSAKEQELAYTGFGGEYGRTIDLIMSDDTSVPVETASSNTGDYNAFIKATVAPGAAVNASLKFYPSQSVLDDAAVKPKKLLINIDPKAINPNIMPFHYPIADPSFRIKLDCDKKV